ncbi:hypothetical protein D9758_011062 [Tetrapyrgos nigripes]|uniref:Uncharacterized protein n=1 Tax=Tetrapyrgos nigripes TaxID=182062 RepID=A0A8H5CU97_9AGAR|nr:hypothetical protein D9758_011062 [Tetrapyrgos nigripes]
MLDEGKEKEKESNGGGGLTFFLLGYLKLGSIIGFFPRHILVGCIGGVGVFLVETGLTVSLRLPDSDSFSYIPHLFSNGRNIVQWVLPLVLAVGLRVITTLLERMDRMGRWRVGKWNQLPIAHKLTFPENQNKTDFVIIPVLFYIIVFAGRMDLEELRREGWLFDVGGGGEGGGSGEPGDGGGASGEAHWYHFYEYLDLNLIHFKPLWMTLPTQFALLFFNVLHPPLNVPALSVSLNEDVDTDKELVAHGYSNLLAGVMGTVPNYLVYVNTLLFYRVGGTTRIAGFLLALATLGLLLMGTEPIAYIPIPVVSALIFVLGIDLVKEALWDTRHRVSKTEYITIFSIMVAMTVWDFVKGVLWGIVVSCFFFVVSNSQRRSIRALHTGDTAMSTVRRPSGQRQYIREVSKQTTILRLQGFLFFGTITQVESTIRSLINPTSSSSSSSSSASNTTSSSVTRATGWTLHPIRFLVLDLTLVYGVDMSAAEAFVRIQRLLSSRYVTLVFCGFEPDDTVGRALRSVDVLGLEGVELFRTFGDAMEWTENAYLRAWYKSLGVRNLKEGTGVGVEMGYGGVGMGIDEEEDGQEEEFTVTSPRAEQLHSAGHSNLLNDLMSQVLPNTSEEPYPTLIKCFSSFEDFSVDKLEPLIPYLKRMSAPMGTVLWRQDDIPDGLYLVEAGILRASYKFMSYNDPNPDPNAHPNAHPTTSISNNVNSNSNPNPNSNAVTATLGAEDSVFNSGIEESMVPGTLAGELTALTGLPRNATVVVERDAVLWKLTNEGLKELEEREPKVAREFTRLVLKASKIDHDTLLSALATRQ